MERKNINKQDEKLLRRVALIGGVAYIILIVLGLFAEVFVRESLIVEGDALLTIQNIVTHESLFRIGLLSDLTMVISDIVVGLAFYILLKHTGQILALSALILRLIQSTLLAGNLLSMNKILIILAQTKDYTDNVQSQVMIELMNFQYGYYLALIFFGIYLILIAYQMNRSKMVPIFIGGFVGVAGFLYFADSIVNFIVPQFNYITGSSVSMLIWTVSELSIAGTLVLIGISKRINFR